MVPLSGPMAALWERFRGTTEERVDALEDSVRRLRAAPDSREPRGDGIASAHKLAGSLGTFGFPEASRLARECEHILMSAGSLTPLQLDLLTAHAASIRAELATQR